MRMTKSYQSRVISVRIKHPLFQLRVQVVLLTSEDYETKESTRKETENGRREDPN